QTILVNSTQTRNLSVMLVVIGDAEEGLKDFSDLEYFVNNNSLFLESTMPVPDNGINLLWNLEKPSFLSKSLINKSFFKKSKTKRLLTEMAMLSGRRIDHIMGIASINDMNILYGDAVGFGSFSYEFGAGVLSYRGGETDSWVNLAHEVSHHYDLCDEYNGYLGTLTQDGWLKEDLTIRAYSLFSSSCKNDYEAEFCEEFDTALGTTVSSCRAPTLKELHPAWEFDYDRNIEDFMEEGDYDILRHYMGDAYGAGFSGWEYYWIESEGYKSILEELSQPVEESLDNCTMISVTFHKNGTIEKNPYYDFECLEESYINNSGNYSVTLFSGQTELLSINYSPPFLIPARNGGFEESNESFLVFSFRNDNITSVKIEGLDDSIQSNRTMNSPLVEIYFPQTNSTHENPFNISWNASDSDNDTLTTVLQIAEDGATWEIYTLGIEDSFYSLDNSVFSYGQYWLKILVSDGFNTNSSVVGPITIIPPPSVSVNSIDEVYSVQGKKVFKGIVENDGGQLLNQTSWEFDVGPETIVSDENVSLDRNEDVFLLFAYNYSSGGAMNISLSAEDGNKSVNDTLVEEFFVGDLRVANLSLTYQNGTQRSFEFVMYNAGPSNLTSINWSFDTNDSSIEHPLSLSTLASHAQSTIALTHTYSDSGEFNSEVTVFNSFNNYSTTLSFIIADYNITDFSNAFQENNRVVFKASLTNELDKPLNASWRLDTGETNITANENTSLSQGEYLFVIAEYDYSTPDEYTSVFEAFDDTHSTSTYLAIDVRELIISQFNHLLTNATEATFRFRATNYHNNNKTLNWSLETGENTITGNNNITLSYNESFFVFTQHNYSSSGTYNTTAKMKTGTEYTEALEITI
ncbi:hypothetical protein GOV10_00020, partial [Candidatus Woesearchaeota archaeon]|nr:hypothetical protein [Candidatus Woesearchaeota archaeon]